MDGRDYETCKWCEKQTPPDHDFCSNRCRQNSHQAGAVVILSSIALMLLILFLLFSGSARACEAHFYGRVAAGWSGNLHPDNDDWVGSDDLAAQFTLGYRAPVPALWGDAWWSAKIIEHNSHWFLNGSDPETSAEHINIGLEWHW